MDDFARYVLGPGLLYMDEFRADLRFLMASVEEDGRREWSRKILRDAGFDRFSILLSESFERQNGSGLETIAKVEALTFETLQSQDDFLEHSHQAERKLFLAHSVLLLGVAFGAVYFMSDLLHVDGMTFREKVSFVGGLTLSALGSYYLIWEYFQWINPFRKYALKEHYVNLVNAWTRFSEVYPHLAIKTIAAAASDKVVSPVTHADAHADAALDALLKNTDNGEVTPHLFELFMRSLEGDNTKRALTILKNIQKRDPNSNYAKLGTLVGEVFEIRKGMEWTCFKRQAARALLRVSALVVGIALFDSMARWLDPERISHWRTLPGAILSTLGARRLITAFWRPERADKVQDRSHKEEAKLKLALAGVMKLDPSGGIVSRIARFDSGKATTQLITRAATDVLATQPSGEVTMQLHRILQIELTRNQISGPRVQHLAEATFTQQRSCLAAILAQAKQWESIWGEEDSKRYGLPFQSQN